MQQATIKVQYVNQPKGNGPGNVKDVDGTYWKVWTRSKKPGAAVLSDFQEGGTYSVTYETENYQGKDYYTITSVTQTATALPQTAAASNGHVMPRQPTAPTDAERMFTCSILNALIQAGRVEASPDDIEGSVHMLRSVWQNTFGADR